MAGSTRRSTPRRESSAMYRVNLFGCPGCCRAPCDVIPRAFFPRLAGRGGGVDASLRREDPEGSMQAGRGCRCARLRALDAQAECTLSLRPRHFQRTSGCLACSRRAGPPWWFPSQHVGGFPLRPAGSELSAGFPSASAWVHWSTPMKVLSAEIRPRPRSPRFGPIAGAAAVRTDRPRPNARTPLD